MSLEYYIGKLGLEADSTVQARHLRQLVMSGEPEKQIIEEVIKYVLSQSALSKDAVMLVNKSFIPQYGAEYEGLGGDNYTMKCEIYKQISGAFPLVPSFKFYYAECMLLDGNAVSAFYPTLCDGILLDASKVYYPSADLFEAIHDSPFSFDFDVLMLQHYYQPCNLTEFADYLADLKEQYTSAEELSVIESLVWLGDSR